MLIRMRNEEGKLIAKDILDIDFNMTVAEAQDVNGKNHYTVKLNDHLTLDEEFDTADAAELALNHIVDCRNELEDELRRY